MEHVECKGGDESRDGAPGGQGWGRGPLPLPESEGPRGGTDVMRPALEAALSLALGAVKYAFVVCCNRFLGSAATASSDGPARAVTLSFTCRSFQRYKLSKIQAQQSTNSAR